MMDRHPPPSRETNDPLLWPLIEAGDDHSREEIIEGLITSCIKPVSGAVLTRFRRYEPNFQLEDLEEVSSGIALRLIRKLRATAIFAEHSIAQLENYVATLTYNALYDFRRKRYPERHRLKRSLLILMRRESRFSVWEARDTLVAGLASWKARPLVGEFLRITASSATPLMQDRARPIEALEAVLEGIGGPIAFEALVDVVADLWNVRDIVIESGEFPPDTRHDQLRSMEARQYLEALWAEIRELPANQRTALLLNLRDSAGSNAVTLLLLLNITSVEEIAGGMGLTEQELNGLWEQLPLDDLTIASRLQLTRQQVINLRKSARLRLARRMDKWR
jgi:hypothetical protein